MTSSPRLRLVSSMAPEASWSFVVDDHARGAEFLIDGRDRDVGCTRSGQELRCELRGMFPGGHTLELRLPGAVLKRSVLIGHPWPERILLSRVRDESELEAAARAPVDGAIIVGGDRLQLVALAHQRGIRALLLASEAATLAETAADGVIDAPISPELKTRFPELRSFFVDPTRSAELAALVASGRSDGWRPPQTMVEATTLLGGALALGAPGGAIVSSAAFPLLDARHRHSALRRGEVAVRAEGGLVRLDFSRGSDRMVILCNVSAAVANLTLDLPSPLSLLGQTIEANHLVLPAHDVAMIVATPSNAAPAEIHY